MEDWSKDISDVESRADLAAFVEALARDSSRNRAGWENVDLGRYLEAVAAWINDMDGYYDNLRGEPAPETPSWRTLARILATASIYE